MIRLREIFVREIRLPLRERFQISSGGVEERRVCLIEVIDVDGCSGWGECVAGELPYYSPETIDTAWLAMRQWLAPRLRDVEFTDPRGVAVALAENIRGHGMARAALEMACWELDARRKNVSLSRLLGGTRDRVGSGISLGLQTTPAALVERAEAALAAGYSKIKMKIKPGQDLAYVRAVHQALAGRLPLMVDANNAYTLADLPLLQALDELQLLMIEQPLAWDDLVRHAQLQAQLQTPICLDESITCLARAEDMVALGSGRIANIKPGRVGGHTESLAIHDFCRQRGVPVWCGGMLESGVGRAHNVALASLPNFTLPGDISPSSRYWQQDIVTPEWELEDGHLRVPIERPGMGVEVNRQRIAQLLVREEQIL